MAEQKEDMLNRILGLLAERNITQKEMVTTLGMSRSAVTDWKLGRSKPTLANVIKIANYFNISLDMLATGKEFKDNTTPEEKQLLNAYRELSTERRKQLEHYIKFLTFEQLKDR